MLLSLVETNNSNVLFIVHHIYILQFVDAVRKGFGSKWPKLLIPSKRHNYMSLQILAFPKMQTNVVLLGENEIPASYKEHVRKRLKIVFTCLATRFLSTISMQCKSQYSCQSQSRGSVFNSSIESTILSQLHLNNGNSQISQSDLYWRNREVWAYIGPGFSE